MLAFMARESRSTTLREQQLASAAVLLSDYSDSIATVLEHVIGVAPHPDVKILGHLQLHSAQRPHDLMVVTGLSRPAVAAVVARLERLGLVQREFGEFDRRTILTSLSPSGRRRMRDLDTALDVHFTVSSPQVTAILDLLGCVDDGAALPAPDCTPTLVQARLGLAREAYTARLDDLVRALHPRQRVAISALMSRGRARPTQLADALHLSSGGLTYLMDQLEADGIITRRHGDAEDRRAVFIELSGMGVGCGRSICAAMAASSPEICEALSLTRSRRPPLLSLET
jgi:DNA-binding MarR family transcriptional regulator